MPIDRSVPLPFSPVSPTSMGEVGPFLTDVEATLARGEAFTLDDWLRLARHPALREGVIGQGWGVDQRPGPPVVKAAARLNAFRVAQAVQGMATLERATLLNSLVFTPQGDARPRTALSASVMALPQSQPEFIAAAGRWTPAQRASQEVIVGLLLAAGALPTGDTWRSAASVRSFTEDGEAEDTNPRVLRRLLAVTSPWSHLGHEDHARLLNALGERRTPWPEDVLNALLDSCPNVDMVNSDGASPLNWAAGQDHPQVPLMRALLAHGANPLQTSNDGRQAVHHWAWANGEPEVLDLLIEHGAALDSVQVEQPPRVAHPMIQGRNRDHHPHAASTVPNGLMPTHIAAIGGCARAMEHLLTLGADPEVPDLVTGNTPLHWAVFTRRADLVERLLATGMDAHLRNRQGLTPSQMLDLPYVDWTRASEEAVVRAALERCALHETLHVTANQVVELPPIPSSNSSPSRVRSRL